MNLADLHGDLSAPLQTEGGNHVYVIRHWKFMCYDGNHRD